MRFLRLLSALKPALPIRPAAEPAPLRLIMIMGVQRSGTTAFSETLATDRSIHLRGERPDDDIYDDFFLRPEPEIRPVLARIGGTLVLKPVRESKRRAPHEVAAEYADYDLRIVWLHRNPCNVYRSWREQGWAQQASQPQTFIGMWCRRNLKALESREALGDRLMFVRYEDLAESPQYVQSIGEALGLSIQSTLRADRGADGRDLPPGHHEAIELGCASTLARLDAARSIAPPS
jgi:hypothetical protein